MLRQTLVNILIIFILFLGNLKAEHSIFTKEEKDYIKNNTFKVAVMPNVPPFNFYEDGEFKGLSKDILDLINSKHGLKFEFEFNNWTNNLEKFKEKKVDIIDLISFKQDRLEYTNYTNSYFELPVIIFTRKDFKDYNSLEDLKGLTLGLTTNVYYENEIIKTNLFNIKYYNDLDKRVKALALGEIDLIFGHLQATQSEIVKQGFTNIKVLDELKLPNVKKTDFRYGITKENETLYKIFNKALDNITNQEWNQIYGKWITNSNYNSKESLKENLNLSKEELTYIKNKKVLKVQNEKNWPPYNYNVDGEAKGFSIDYTNLIAKKLNLKIEYVKGHSWDEYMQMLKHGKIDIINNISKNKKREKFIDFTDIFHTAANAIYVTKGNEKIDSLEKLEGKTIVMPKGFFAQQLIEKHYPKINQILVKDSLQALRYLSLGKADATIGKKNVLDYIISTNNISGVIATNFVDDNRLVSLIRMGVPKGEKHLQSILQKAQDSVTDEELLTLKRKWFGETTFKKKEEVSISNLEKEYLEKKGEIKYCINNNLTPIEFLNSSKKPEGISIDILNNFANKLNIRLRHISTSSLEQSYKFLEQRKCDIISSIENDKIPLKNVLTTNPYLNYNLAIITRKNIPVVPSINEIIDKTIALKANDQVILELKSKYPNINIIQTQSNHRSLEAVNKNDAYYTLAPLPIAAYYMSEYAMNDLYISRYTNMDKRW